MSNIGGLDLALNEASVRNQKRWKWNKSASSHLKKSKSLWNVAEKTETEMQLWGSKMSKDEREKLRRRLFGSPACPVSSYRFYFTLHSTKEPQTDSYLLELPTTGFDSFRHVDPSIYTPHEHRPRDPDPNPNPNPRFCTLPISKSLRFLCSTPYTLMEASEPIVLGSSVYTLFRERDSDVISLRCISLDGHFPTKLPDPISPNRLAPKALALDGQLYFLGGLLYPLTNSEPNSKRKSKAKLQPFGEGFNPTTKSWFKLAQPPDAAALIASRVLFIASLGEHKRQIMVHNPVSEVLYIYDIPSRLWEMYNCPDLFPPRLPKSIMGVEVCNEYDQNIYWLAEDCFIYAFDSKTRRIFSGPIVGLEREGVFLGLEYVFSGVTLHHLWENMFCLFWDLSVNESDIMEYHFTFLKVIKDPLDGVLSAFVVGCFMGEFSPRASYSDALLVQ